MDKINAGIVLKQILYDKGIKQSWVAEQVNLSKSDLSQRLKKNISIELLLKILDLINISFQEFTELYKDKKDVGNPAKNTPTSPSEI